MWPKVEQDLTQLLSTRIFPGLRGLAAYEKLLKPNGQPDAGACMAAAHVIVNNTDLKSGIKEFGSRETPKVGVWAKPICRAVSPKNYENGYWWFDEELVQRWGRTYPPGTPNRKQEILESIRPMLAVCFDWNDFTDLRLMRTDGGIPVITGQGAHKPIYSPTDKEHRNEAYSNVVFIGGFTQIFVPFVNPAVTSLYRF
jgi:hypothetical protein